ncbi:MAG: hypothetical protein ACHQK9_09885 [Reyranellales bacterium]
MLALLRLAAPYIAVTGLVLCGLWYVYHKGETDERNSNAADVLKETDEARKLREDNEARERARSDDDAVRCLRNPQGCR